MHSLARFALAGLTLLSSVASSPLLGAPAPAPSAPFPPPDSDPFYVAPSNLASYTPGAIIRSRPVNTVVANDSLAQAYQVYYRTVVSAARTSEPAGSVATIFVPKKPATDKTSIFSYQAYEDSVSFNCAPSWNLVANSNGPNTGTTTIDTPSTIGQALGNGWYVVAADHEGKNSAFISGVTEGVTILDALRATINFQKLNKKAQIGLYGYSGGAHATAWAVNLAGKYAPELNVIGAAHSGTPIDPRGIFNFLNGGAFSGFAGAGVAGLMNAHPDLENFIQRYLTPHGKEIINKVRSKDTCLSSIVSGYGFIDFLKEINYKDPLNAPIPKKYLVLESLDDQVNPDGVYTPKFPTLQMHAGIDEIVPFDAHAKFVDAQCARGATVEWGVLQGADHVIGEVTALAPSMTWLTQAFAGTLKKPKVCGTGAAKVVPSSKLHAENAVGSEKLSQLQALRAH